MVIYTKWSSISQSQWWNLVIYNIDDATNQYVTCIGWVGNPS